jgi:phosphopentomutase
MLSKRRKIALVLLAVAVLGRASWAAGARNVIVVCVDGVSREALYSLLAKHKLKAMDEIVARGGVRNLDVEPDVANPMDSYRELLAASPSENGETVFDVLKQRLPRIETAAILSVVAHGQALLNVDELLNSSASSVDIRPKSTTRNVDSEGLLLVRAEKKLREPFFIVANLTNVEEEGHRSREGGEAYSDEIEHCDRVLGVLIDKLKDENRWMRTDIWLVTTFGFEPHGRQHIYRKDSWVMATQKILRKGTSADILPSIYATFHIDWRTVDGLRGTPLNR